MPRLRGGRYLRAQQAIGARSTETSCADSVEQLTRYLELLNRDPLLAPVQGIFAAQEIRSQPASWPRTGGIRCVVLDYDAMGAADRMLRLF